MYPDFESGCITLWWSHNIKRYCRKKLWLFELLKTAKNVSTFLVKNKCEKVNNKDQTYNKVYLVRFIDIRSLDPYVNTNKIDYQMC